MTGRLVTSVARAKNKGGQKPAHIFDGIVNGNIRTACGWVYAADEAVDVTDDRAVCRGCERQRNLIDGDPRRFVRNAYGNGRR